MVGVRGNLVDFVQGITISRTGVSPVRGWGEGNQ
jgi:hypothetical protein